MASSLADRVEPHKARFVEAGFNPTFVDEEYKRGRKLVRFIDRVVTPVWAKTPEKLSEWKTAWRFPRFVREGQGTDAVTPTLPQAGQAVTGRNIQPDNRAA